MPYLIATAFVPLLAVLLYAFVLFDRLLRTEYEQHRPAWEADGRPSGFFWRVREHDFLLRMRSGLAGRRLTIAWLFRIPPWVAGSPALVAMLRRYRFSVLVWNVGLLVLFVIFLSRLHD